METIASRRWQDILTGLLILFGLYLTHFENYLLFHSLAEGFSIMVSLGVFMIAWNCRRFIDNNYLLFLGIALLFVSALDMLHTLSYAGTGVFPGRDVNLPTQLWVAARALQAVSFLLAPLFFRRRLPMNAIMAVYALVTAFLIWDIFALNLCPDCWASGGLTPFKVAAEWAIAATIAVSALLLRRVRAHFEPSVYHWLLAALVLSVLSELSFSHYIELYGPTNMAGHLLKIASFFCIYKAIIETGLIRPFDLLFRNLKRSEEELRGENDQLLALQRELAAKNQELSALNEQKNQFLGMAAHDLRSPLSVITWYSEVLAERAPESGTADQREFLGIIRRSSEFMLGLIDNLLDIAKIESGKLELDLQPTDLAELVAHNVRVNGILASRKRINLVFRSTAELPPILVDPGRLEQVLNNLISNAVKFSHPGSTVEVALGREGEKVLLSVCDEGQGVPHGELGNLFEPFQTTSVRGTEGEKSTGLGLAVVRKMVEAHQGTIRVESTVGRGTTFFITLPLHRNEPHARPITPQSPTPPATSNPDGD